MKIELKKEVSVQSGKDIYVIYTDNFPVDLFFDLKSAEEKYDVIKKTALKPIEPIILKSEEVSNEPK